MTDIKFDRQSLKENLTHAIQQVVILNFTVPEALRRRQSFIPSQASMSRAQNSERMSANTSIMRHESHTQSNLGLNTCGNFRTKSPTFIQQS